MGDMTIAGDLTGVSRCPHCSIASPQLARIWNSDGPVVTTKQSLLGRMWALYKCSTCAGLVLVRCGPSRRSSQATGFAINQNVEQLYPTSKSAHNDIPDPAKTFLQQAFDTLHAPDAAAVMAGSAVDAMLKHHGLVKGSLYARIDEALAANLLTQGMADWANAVRLGSNRPRHADAEKPHVSANEAKQSVEFAEALGNFLFVLTARINRGLEATGAAPTKISKAVGRPVVSE